jgi:3-carboxy-cis,cis-muconate cycloisomerase
MSKFSENRSSFELAKDVFSLEKRLQYMLRFESALARSQAASGLIPDEAATVICDVCGEGIFDAENLERRGSRAGTLVVPLVKDLAAQTKEKSEEASRFVHFGATSQDVLDTAMVLQLKQAVSLIEEDLFRIEAAFDTLARKHANTVMLGRTLLQAGPPISFGLKVAGWKAAIARGHQRLSAAAESSLILQFGGAVGNLSTLNSNAMKVAQILAEELELSLPDAPWHSHRDRLAELVSAAGILIGSLGKIARDMSLLMQSEVEELNEPSVPVRGVSSAMPHKRNPVGCMQILTAATRAPALVSSFLTAMPQEHERGLGGWQAEWTILPDLFLEASRATNSMVEIAEGLEVNTSKMLSNLEATNQVVFSERLSAALLPKLGRMEAQELVSKLVAASVEKNRKLSEVASDNSTVQSCLSSELIEDVFDHNKALGSSAEWMDRLLKGEGA